MQLNFVQCVQIHRRILHLFYFQYFDLLPLKFTISQLLYNFLQTGQVRAHSVLSLEEQVSILRTTGGGESFIHIRGSGTRDKHEPPCD